MGQQLLGVQHPDRAELQHQPWRLRSQHGVQRRGEQLLQVVVGGDAHTPARRRRIEGPVGGEDPIDLFERGVDQRQQLLRLGRQHHAVALAHQQRIVEHVPHALQRLAHRRLRHVERLGGFGDAGAAQQRSQRHQLIQIESPQPDELTRRRHGRILPMRVSRCRPDSCRLLPWTRPTRSSGRSSAWRQPG